jgi:osmotically-inducible protein OsmY
MRRTSRHTPTWRYQFAIASSLVSILFIASIGLTGCNLAQQRADDELAARIDRALLASDELNLSRIEVNVESGVIYLSGMSDDHESKVHAEKEARALAGDRKIVNKVEIDF